MVFEFCIPYLLKALKNILMKYDFILVDEAISWKCLIISYFTDFKKLKVIYDDLMY